MTSVMQAYNPKQIEPKWQQIWEQTGVYTADLKSSKPKYISMSMFNYPSGAGIHIGHAMNYTISDVKARFKRQQGYESYHPYDMGGLNNRGLLCKEITDVVAVLSAMDDAEDIDFPAPSECRAAWRQKLCYSHHQEQPK